MLLIKKLLKGATNSCEKIPVSYSIFWSFTTIFYERICLFKVKWIEWCVTDWCELNCHVYDNLKLFLCKQLCHLLSVSNDKVTLMIHSVYNEFILTIFVNVLHFLSFEMNYWNYTIWSSWLYEPKLRYWVTEQVEISSSKYESDRLIRICINRRFPHLCNFLS